MINALHQTFAVHVTSGPGNQNFAHCWIHYCVYSPVQSPDFVPFSKFYCHCDIHVSVTYINVHLQLKRLQHYLNPHAFGNQTLSFVGGIKDETVPCGWCLVVRLCSSVHTLWWSPLSPPFPNFCKTLNSNSMMNIPRSSDMLRNKLLQQETAFRDSS